MTVIHPKPGPKGQKVIIHKPSTPSAAPTWQDAEDVATFVPEGPSPSMLNGISVAPITIPRREMDWAGQARSRDFHEPDFEPPSGLKPAAGAVVVEPDGRVWIVHPTNAFAGYQATFPKGTVGKGVGLRATALREVFEESGLLVELLDFLTDSKRSMSYTRYYVARRIGGSPVDMGWESQAVSLVPFEHLTRYLNHAVDHAIVEALLDRKQAWTTTWLAGRQAIHGGASGGDQALLENAAHAKTAHHPGSGFHTGCPPGPAHATGVHPGGDGAALVYLFRARHALSPSELDRLPDL